MPRTALMETNYFVAIFEKPVKDQWMNSEKSSVCNSLYRADIFLVLGGRTMS